MSAVFLKLVNLSIGAGWLVLAAVIFRFVFKKAPKALRCVVWALVAVRLVLPFTIESPIALAPKSGGIPDEVITAASTDKELVSPERSLLRESGIMESTAPERELPATGVSAAQPVMAEQAAPAAKKGPTLGTVVSILTGVWLGGVAAMLVYSLISFVRLKLSLRISAPLYDNIIICDDASTPFILGLFRPVIVLPSSISREDARFAIAHERAHIERRDHLIKPFAFLLLSVYWFNPLMWLAYVLLSRDIELACDERVIRKGGAEIKKGYSEALINCSVSRRRVSACPVAFGEVGVKERVRSVLSYKKSTVAVMLAALMCCAAIGVFLIPTRSVPAEAEEIFVPNELTVEAESSDPWKYDRVYVLENKGLKLKLSVRDFRYSVEKTAEDGTAEVDRGTFSYTFLYGVTLVSDADGSHRHFSIENGTLIFRSLQEMPLIFAAVGSSDDDSEIRWTVNLSPGSEDPAAEGWTGSLADETCFLLAECRADDASYHSSNGNTYIWYPESKQLYVFGDPRGVLRDILNEPDFAEDPVKSGYVTDALSKLKWNDVGCRFTFTDNGIMLSSGIRFYTEEMIVCSDLICKVRDVINVDCTALMTKGDSVNRLTPGSLYTKGGFRIQ